ncbi:MAG: ribonuclease HI [Myxococcaceae bacterium]|nr:ribonuclease HI [Myxococcaceae bacterium]MBH2006580.1 ribonuclease HI [Myxococcaceae bacterium]
MDEVEVYTDGSCLKNPGPGGWAALLKVGEHEKLVSGFQPNVTNNQMELLAAIQGLKALKRPCRVTLFSDSQYVVRGMSEWVFNWQRRGWKTASNKPVENQSLWQELVRVAQIHEVEWEWIKAHAGHEYNERVDQEARAQAQLCCQS